MTPRKLTKPAYSITDPDWKQAIAEYGECNCGPSALAIMLGLPAMEVLPHIPGYKERHYVSPTMMKQALAALGVKITHRPLDDSPHTLTNYGLCRIQFEGPWTAEGANPKWAYRQTHWVGAAELRWNLISDAIGATPMCVFDVNCGWKLQPIWEIETVPAIIKECIPRATGGWFVTHRWELEFAS